MDYVSDFYPESRFGGYSDIDGTVTFYTRVHALLEPSFTVVDVGCGRGAYEDDPIPLRRGLRILRGRAGRVIGLDVDAAAADNPHLDEFQRLEGDRWPLADSSADMCVSDNVLEHVANPEAYFSEMRRVLRDGGLMCLRTPNSRSYVALIARLVPNRHHATVTRRVQDGRKDEDVFPTLYRCNTRGKLRRMLDRHGFQHVVYSYEAEPSYLSFSRAAYWLGVLHQRFAPRCIKPALFAFARLHKDAG